MKERYVVLRSLYGDGQVQHGAPKAGARATGFTAELEEIDSMDAPGLAQDSGVKGFAPAMPMRLIAPLEYSGAPQTAAVVTWGVRAVRADACPFDGAGVTVAVLDSGIDDKHAAFAGIDLVQKDFTGEGDGDTNGHGTHCAGTIFGRDVEGTRIGVARGVKRALIGKVIAQNGAASEAIAQAVLWAVSNGANVISMSIGIDFPGYVKEQEALGVPTQVATTRALDGYRANILLFERIATLLRTEPWYQGVVIVAAAGNESRRADNPPYVLSVSPPAVADGILSVAALGEGAQGYTVAPFSNVGAKVAGPGVGITSAATGGGLCAKSGTSMATPHVAGVAALWAQQLEARNRLSSGLLLGQVMTSAVTAGLASISPADVGAGLVIAPQA